MQFSMYCLDISKRRLTPTCNSEFNQCYTALVNNVVHRGCVSVNDPHFPNAESLWKCSNPAECKICNDSSNCNSNTVTDTCIQCKGFDPMSACHNDLTNDQIVACSLRTDVKQLEVCYLNVTGDTYIRGCMHDLDLSKQKVYTRTHNENCQSCKLPNCNRKEEFSTSCYECHGDIITQCLYGVKFAAQVNCNDYTKTCATGIDGNGFTHRGCISYHRLESTFPLGFETCPKHLCNKQIFPSDRLKCYQCEGIYECPTLDNLEAQICNNYLDQCYAYLDQSILKKII